MVFLYTVKQYCSMNFENSVKLVRGKSLLHRFSLQQFQFFPQQSEEDGINSSLEGPASQHCSTELPRKQISDMQRLWQLLTGTFSAERGSQLVWQQNGDNVIGWMMSVTRGHRGRGPCAIWVSVSKPLDNPGFRLRSPVLSWWQLLLADLPRFRIGDTFTQHCSSYWNNWLHQQNINFKIIFLKKKPKRDSRGILVQFFCVL